MEINRNNIRIVFMGTPAFGVGCLDRLINDGYNIVGVVTVPDKISGRGLKLESSEVKKYSLLKGLNLYQPINLKDREFLDDIKSLRADIFVVVAFRKLPRELYTLPSMGSINLHASYLPYYRGAAPINRVIINGEKETGVTTFLINDEIDKGNILLRRKVKIDDDDDAGSLHDKLLKEGSDILVETIDRIYDNSITVISQDDYTMEYPIAPKLTKEECLINWSDYVFDIHNKIRGLSPNPGAYSIFCIKGEKKKVKIFKSSYSMDILSDNNSYGKIYSDNVSYMGIFCKGGVLFIRELQVEGKKRINIVDFLRGYDVNKIIVF